MVLHPPPNRRKELKPEIDLQTVEAPATLSFSA
jgi:hypothetical protein